MNRAGDYSSTPNEYKKLADEVAKNIGMARTSEVYPEDEELIFKNKFLTIESITVVVGYELRVVETNGVSRRLFPNAPPMDNMEFRMFLKGLTYAFRFRNQQMAKQKEIDKAKGDGSVEN